MKNGEPEFILNKWFQAEYGGLMNVTQIKKARAAAAAQVLEILKKLEHDTGMVVGHVEVDYDMDEDGHSTGAESVKINLELT